MMNRYFYFIVLLVLFSSPISGQRFKAAAVIGMNASQIDGDSLFGFDKAGFSAGFRLSYINNKSFDFALEMLYSQRGSGVKVFRSGGRNSVSLNYLELPLIVSLRDWYNEKEDYHKVRAEAGLSYGYLFGAESIRFDVDRFKRHDISWILGIGLNLNKMIGLSLRYTSSFTNMYQDPSPENRTFKGYFFTLRTEVNF